MPGQIAVKIRGLKQVQNLFFHLDKNLAREIKSEQMEFMRRVKKSAKLRAPRRTGKLADSISLIKIGSTQINLIVGSPYGWFQEAGFAPHWVYGNMPDRVGGTIGGTYGKTGFMYVQKFKPFIAPAVEANLPLLPEKLMISVQKAVRGSSK